MKVFWVTKRLAFGSAVTTQGHIEKLRALGITHIINLRWSTNARVGLFPHIWLRFHDDDKPRPRWFYRRALQFYRKAMKHPQAKVLVMCHHGRCRSASLVYFLLRTKGRSVSTAEHLITEVRSCASIVPAYKESADAFLNCVRSPSGHLRKT
jgi:Dual specificity phosphatase, catalytic domain